ncbi:DUF3618 domain-containing protein [Actinokineospora sp.]|uniref:DUF3618 domain-containing protein n=1 Tax=Actinokineospora sp. TaxID=1872133 RepID=UPI003D6A61B6
MSRPDDLREDIQRVRGDLAETVDALVAKTEVKRRVEEKAHDVKDRAVHKAHEIKDRAAEKAHEVKEKAQEVKQRADAKAHEVKDRVETKAHEVKNRGTHATEHKIDSWGGKADGRVEAVRHRADRPSGSHPLGQVTELVRRTPVQAGALGLLIGALIALITRRRAR